MERAAACTETPTALHVACDNARSVSLEDASSLQSADKAGTNAEVARFDNLLTGNISMMGNVSKEAITLLCTRSKVRMGMTRISDIPSHR